MLLLRFLLIFLFNFKFCVCEFEKLYEKYANKNREELVVKNLETQEDFKLELNVTKWRSISIFSKSISVGISEQNLIVIEFTENQNKTLKLKTGIFDLKFDIFDVILYQKYTQGNFVVTSSNNPPSLKWFKVENSKISEIWKIPLRDQISFIDIFTMEDQEKIILLNKDSDAAIYNFDLEGRKFWLDQYISLSKEPKSAAYIQHKWDHFLGIAQENLLTIFKYHNKNFYSYKNISSEKIDQVLAFEIGFKAFFAINGQNPGIFQLMDEGIKEEKLENSHLENLKYWMVLKVSEYRDESILLTQKSLHHDPHNSTLIDLLTYNGENFVEHEDIPCNFFGEETNSLNCLLDSESGKNLLDIAQITVNDRLALIVPGQGQNSLFHFHFDVVMVGNPLLEEIEMFEKQKRDILALLKRVDTVEELDSVGTGQASGQDSVIVGAPPTDLLGKLGENIEALKKDLDGKLKSFGNLDSVTIDGSVEVMLAKVQNLDVNYIDSQIAFDLLDNIVQNNDSFKEIIGRKTFNNVTVTQLNVQRTNGIPSNRLVFKTDQKLDIRGNPVFNSTVEAGKIFVRSGYLNDEPIEDNIVVLSHDGLDELNLKNVVVSNTFQANKVNHLEISKNLDKMREAVDPTQSTAFIPGNLTVKNINGESFKDFLRQLCLKNLKCYIAGDLRINGNITVDGNAHTDYLNEVSFPGNYIFNDHTPHYNITGKKDFKYLQVGQMRVQRFMNNIEPKFITLTTQQKIPGTVQFEEIEVAEEININGDIEGKDLDKFLSNPTLSKNTTRIASKATFKKLIVQGNIIVSSTLNNQNYQTLIQDFVYKDQENTIKGLKEFSQGITVKKDLQITSNKINGVNLDDFVTKDTDQILDIHTLNGNVDFDDLLLDGLYGQQNITKIDQESVKLTGEQYITSTLIFKEDLDIKNLEIQGKLNDLAPEQYLYSTGDRAIGPHFDFGEITANSITIEGQVIGKMANLDLENLDKNALQDGIPQNITGNWDLNQMQIKEANIKKINDQNFASIFNHQQISDQMMEQIKQGNVKIQNLHVNGPLNVSTINNQNMTGNLPKTLILENDLHLSSLEIQKLSGVDFQKFLDSIVFKNERDLEIEGQINFQEGIYVQKLVETEKINNIDVDEILTKFGDQNIDGAVIIDGDVYFDDVEILGKANQVTIGDLKEMVNITSDGLTVNGDVVFKKNQKIVNLTVSGQINDQNPDLVKNLVDLREPIDLRGNTTFLDPITINGNLVSGTYNDINLSQLLSNVVLTTKKQVITGPINFSNETIALNYVLLEENLRTGTLFGIDIDGWRDRAIFVNRGLLKGNYKFEDIVVQENIVVETINNLDTNNLITLRTNQTIPIFTVQEATFLKNFEVYGNINGFDLAQELPNSLTIDGNHMVNSEIIFGDMVLVQGQIKTDKINGIDVRKIVTTNTDQELRAQYDFQMKCELENLRVDGLMNNINVSAWNEDMIREKAGKSQKVMKNWDIAQNLTLQDDVDGTSVINGVNLVDMEADLSKKLDYKLQMEKAIIDDYNNLCRDVEKAYEFSKQQIYKFRYFDTLDVMVFQEKVDFVFPFKHNNNNYLLVHEENNCQSRIMLFSNTTFLPLTSFESGLISQVIPVHGGPLLYLVTRGASSSDCTLKGTNIWSFVDEKMDFFAVLNDQMLLQESLVPKTFYGMQKGLVTEFVIAGSFVKPFRKWEVEEENLAFVPRGFKTGLALTNGRKLIKLEREDSDDEDLETSLDVEVVIKGKTLEDFNPYIPGRLDGDMVTTTVGTKESKRTLLAVASHEDISVKGPLDFITIYSDPINGRVFHKLSTYKPSSLLSIEFGNGETLLIFQENKRLLQVYEYKGINGFKHRLSARLIASRLFQMKLPVAHYSNERMVIGALNGNKITLLQSVMSGNQVQENLTCKLP